MAKDEVKKEVKEKDEWVSLKEKEEKEKDGWVVTAVTRIDGEKKYKLEKPSA